MLSSKLPLTGLLCTGVVAVLGARAVEAQHHHHHFHQPHTHFHQPQYHQPHYHQPQVYAHGTHSHGVHYPSYSQITFGARSHVDSLASDLKNATSRLAWDMHANYAHNPGYADVYRLTYKMLQDAKHIHALVWEEQYHHQHHEQDHIAADLAEIDRLFHHIQQSTAGWTPSVYNPYHDQGLLTSKMQSVESLLHHLMSDYGVRSQFAGGVGGAPPAPISGGASSGFAPPSPGFQSAPGNFNAPAIGVAPPSSGSF